MGIFLGIFGHTRPKKTEQERTRTNKTEKAVTL